MKKEVSGRAVSALLFAVEKEKILVPDHFFPKSGLTPKQLKDLKSWYDWQTFVDLYQALDPWVGSKENWMRVGKQIHSTTPMMIPNSAAAIFLDTRFIFWAGISWIAPSFFRCITFEFRDLSGGWIEATATIPESYAECPQYFWTIASALQGVPKAILGQHEPEIITAISGRRLVMQIKPAPSLTLYSRFKKQVKTMNLVRAVTEGLFFQENSIENTEGFRTHSMSSILSECFEKERSRLDELGIQIRSEVRVMDDLLPCRRLEMVQMLSNLMQYSCDAVVQAPVPRWIQIELSSLDQYLSIKLSHSGKATKELHEGFFRIFFNAPVAPTNPDLNAWNDISRTHRIIREHGGRLTYDSESAVPAFVVLLPKNSGVLTSKSS